MMSSIDPNVSFSKLNRCARDKYLFSTMKKYIWKIYFGENFGRATEIRKLTNSAEIEWPRKKSWGPLRERALFKITRTNMITLSNLKSLVKWATSETVRGDLHETLLDRMSRNVSKTSYSAKIQIIARS